MLKYNVYIKPFTEDWAWIDAGTTIDLEGLREEVTDELARIGYSGEVNIKVSAELNFDV